MTPLSALAQASDLGVLAIIAIPALFVAVLIGSQRSCDRCGKWFAARSIGEKVLKEDIERSDEWVMENTAMVVREVDRLGPTSWEDSRKQSREYYHEKVKYEVESVTRFAVALCACRFCGHEWSHELAPQKLTRRNRAG